uniref:Vacuolar protein sorting-associated protein 28 homolog n=1 Tax=Ditylum brightwellii TaxID=49249 RepID=A0A6V2IMC3_9STRA|mmetsp:Transcript_4922/g.6411  ORF Transcript_4922/g.6411 Transcript_4922/m.6411 type:complete len:221 (-) Transcript_4922:401-1063(-)
MFSRPGMERMKSEGLQEIELFESSKEREAYENLADLYTVIVATEHLERAYARDAITQQEYTSECNKLISQFRLAEKAALGSSMTTETFMQLYQMDCPRARERLLIMGVPEQIKTSDDSGHHVAVTVAETVQHFITAMDAVKLEQRAVDELQPLLSDLMDALTQLPETPNDFEPNKKVQTWLQTLNSMRAVDQIDEDDARQLYHDLDSAYADFTRHLKRKK